MTSSNVIENDRKSISWLPWFTGRLVLYVIEHHNQSLSAGIWADMNYLSRITNVWIPWQSSVCVSRIIGDKIDVWNVNLKHFPYRHPLKVDERWPWTPMSSNEVQCSWQLRAAATLGYRITAQTESRGLRTHSTISLNVGRIIYYQRNYGLKRSKLHFIKKKSGVRIIFDDVTCKPPRMPRGGVPHVNNPLRPVEHELN